MNPFDFHFNDVYSNIYLFTAQFV